MEHTVEQVNLDVTQPVNCNRQGPSNMHWLALIFSSVWECKRSCAQNGLICICYTQLEEKAFLPCIGPLFLWHGDKKHSSNFKWWNRFNVSLVNSLIWKEYWLRHTTKNIVSFIERNITNLKYQIFKFNRHKSSKKYQKITIQAEINFQSFNTYSVLLISSLKLLFIDKLIHLILSIVFILCFFSISYHSFFSPLYQRNRLGFFVFGA